MLKKYFDLGFKKSDLIAFFAVIACCLFIKLTGISEIYENSLLENIQLIPLGLGAIFCFRAKNHKIFFKFVGLVLILAFLRELSYGRVIFCAVPNEPHEFYKWSHYKYGWLAHVIIGFYIAASCIWAIINKIWLDVADIFRKVKIPIWTFCWTFIAIFLQFYSEKNSHNTCLEETAELAIYCFVLSLVLIYYSKLKNE